MSESAPEQIPDHDENADNLAGEEVEPEHDLNPSKFPEDTDEDEVDVR